jgi:hypothetical protein
MTHPRRYGLVLSVEMLLALAAALPGAVAGQSCDALVPSGGDDAPIINACLNSASHATLTANTFLIYQPIQAISFASGVSLAGAGKSATHISAVFTCGDPRFVDAGGNYKIPVEVRRSPFSTLHGFHLDLSALRQDCGHGGNYAVVVNRSANSTLASLKITGSLFGSANYTTGWGNGGGILVVNSANSIVDSVVVKDVGFITAGFSGIQVNSSGSSTVQNSSVTNVAFGLQVVNGSPSQGYDGDSSKTTITGNNITGPAALGCTSCTAGRAFKLQACGVGDELPIQYLTVTGNTGTNWGGPNQGAVVPSGLDLVCGAQYSSFSNNSFIGDNRASYGLEIRSSFMSPQNASHHNVFTNNTFRSGSCSGCFDVYFTTDGPDQGSGGISGTPSIGRRADGGSNVFGTVSWAADHGCAQFAHAFWQYPAGQISINRGQFLTVAAAGIRPDSSLPVTFVWKDPGGNTVLTRSFFGANGNCVLNQQTIWIDPGVFRSPGLYKVYATYSDGNSSALIANDWIGTGGQQVALDVR